MSPGAQRLGRGLRHRRALMLVAGVVIIALGAAACAGDGTSPAPSDPAATSGPPPPAVTATDAPDPLSSPSEPLEQLEPPEATNTRTEAPPAAADAVAEAVAPAVAQAVAQEGGRAPLADDGRRIIAGLDTTLRSVDLEDIEFDLYPAKVSLAEASERVVREMVDAIPPLDSALDLLPPAVRARVGSVRYITAGEADFLTAEAVVVGYVADDGQPYAFSLGVLRNHELVNDTLGGRAVLISYCPLCRSAVVYDRVVDGRLLTFGNTSALYQNDMVMFDRQTNSYWFQTGGEAIIGPLTGSRLAVRPSQLAPWESWRRLHPDTLVLSTETGFVANYSERGSPLYATFVSAGHLPFSVDAEILADTQLDLAELVLGLEVGGTARAYPLDQLGTAAVNDAIEGQAVVVFASADGPTGAAFDPTVEGRRLTFDADGDAYRDRETGSRWSLSGQAIAGPLAGHQLTPLPARTAYWFSYLSAFRDATVAGQEGPADEE